MYQWFTISGGFRMSQTDNMYATLTLTGSTDKNIDGLIFEKRGHERLNRNDYALHFLSFGWLMDIDW